MKKLLTNFLSKKVWRWGLSLILLSSILLGIFYKKSEAVVGISTRFVDVTLEFLEIGKSYNLRRLRRIPYTVRNRGTAAISVRVDVAIPRKREVMPGYEGIPDPSWIQIVPNEFTLEGGQTGFAEMIIEVPNDESLVGRHFQATIWARTQNTGMFAAGTQSRLRFSIGAGPETLENEAKQNAMMTLDFDVTPPEMYINQLEPGKTYKLNNMVRRKLKVTNRATTPLHMKFNSIPWLSKLNMANGYVAAPDPSWLTFKPKEAIIKEDRIVTVNPILKIPKGDEHRGKKYAFLLKADLIMGVELEVYSKFYVSIKDAPKKKP